jgi:hypothetical protein
MKASFDHHMRRGVLVLIDRDDGHMSITNNAEEVVEYCLKHLVPSPTTLIIYRDTDGNYDQLIHDGSRFGGFGPLRETCLNEAVDKVVSNNKP